MMKIRQTLIELRYSLYVTIHPFKGFWDIKHEGQGSFHTAMVIFVLELLLSVSSAFFTEYLFNQRNMANYNFLMTIAISIGLFVSWCVSNWCFTCLSDGEGTLKDICTVTAYALVPMIIFQAILIPLSHFLIQWEASLYYLFSSGGYIWTGFLILFGILVVHQYSFTKTIIVCIATIIGMGIMMYIVLLFLNLTLEMIAFFSVLLDEIRFVFMTS